MWWRRLGDRQQSASTSGSGAVSEAVLDLLKEMRGVNGTDEEPRKKKTEDFNSSRLQHKCRRHCTSTAWRIQQWKNQIEDFKYKLNYVNGQRLWTSTSVLSEIYCTFQRIILHQPAMERKTIICHVCGVETMRFADHLASAHQILDHKKEKLCSQLSK